MSKNNIQTVSYLLFGLMSFYIILMIHTRIVINLLQTIKIGFVFVCTYLSQIIINNYIINLVLNCVVIFNLN